MAIAVPLPSTGPPPPLFAGVGSLARRLGRWLRVMARAADAPVAQVALEQLLEGNARLRREKALLEGSIITDAMSTGDGAMDPLPEYTDNETLLMNSGVRDAQSFCGRGWVGVGRTNHVCGRALQLLQIGDHLRRASFLPCLPPTAGLMAAAHGCCAGDQLEGGGGGQPGQPIIVAA